MSTQRHAQPRAENKTTPRRLRVLHVITDLAVGGAQDNTLLTVEHFDRTRYDVDLACGPVGEWHKRAASVADRVYVVEALKRNLNPLHMASAVAAVRRVIRNGHYDIVHTHSAHAGIVGRVAARAERVPVVVHTLHTLPGDDASFPEFFRRIWRKSEAWLSRITHATITVSELNRKSAIERRMIDAERSASVYSCIDLAPFEQPVDVPAVRQQLGLTERWPVVGFVGRFAAQNDPLCFIAAAKDIIAKHPNTYFLLVGDGALEPEMRRAAQGFPQFVFAGLRSDVPAVLRAMDVVVSCARWAGLGRAVTEAMLAARPIVATAVGGVPEIVIPGKTGVLVRPGDPGAIAEAVTTLLENPSLARSFGTTAAEITRGKFDLGSMIRGIDDIYQRCLSKEEISASS